MGNKHNKSNGRDLDVVRAETSEVNRDMRPQRVSQTGVNPTVDPAAALSTLGASATANREHRAGSRQAGESTQDQDQDQDQVGGQRRGLRTPEVFAVGLLVLVGIILRFTPRSPLWLDETLTVNISSLPAGEIREALRHDGHPPLYYLMLSVWMDLFGSSDQAARALSAAISIATLPLAWLAGRRLHGPVAGVAALGLYAVNPFAIRYGSEVRQYSLVMLLVFAGFLLLSNAVENPKPHRLLGLTVLSGLLMLTHYWTFWLIGAVGIVLLATAWRGKAERRGPAFKSAVAIGAGGLLFLPWLPTMLFQAENTGTPWGSPVRPTTLIQLSLADFGGAISSEAQLLTLMLVLVVGVGVFGRQIGNAKVEIDPRIPNRVRAEVAIVMLTIVIGTVMGYLSNSAFQGRYASVFIPILLLLAAAGIADFGFRGRLILFGIIAALSIVVGVQNINYQRTQAGDLANEIANEAEAMGLVPPGSGSETALEIGAEGVDVPETSAEPELFVAVCPDQLGPASSRALSQRLPTTSLDIVTYPLLEDPALVDWVDYNARYEASDPTEVAEQLIERSGGEPIFLIWNDGYVGVEGYCGQLHGALAEVRDEDRRLADINPLAFENGNLTVFPK